MASSGGAGTSVLRSWGRGVLGDGTFAEGVSSEREMIRLERREDWGIYVCHGAATFVSVSAAGSAGFLPLGDIVIPKSRVVQQNRRMRTETSVDTEDDDAFFDSEDDDEDQDESK
ncbi:hypothetical protein WN48_09457 [Eufriesea mexicana]|uniref:Uncharacterized protein n=1 Tax=Eufriesea mexicana TaxID=516756 RepID=A0A310SFC6_9HYME|nr:hypothetical protein WN48_09457 [Eufriesea mexicana]